LRVRLENGEVREARVSHNPGGPENPLNYEELEVEFRASAKRALSGDRVEELWIPLEMLDESNGVDSIVRPLRATQRE
jgi:hypothetical protein